MLLDTRLFKKLLYFIQNDTNFRLMTCCCRLMVTYRPERLLIKNLLQKRVRSDICTIFILVIDSREVGQIWSHGKHCCH